MNCVLKAVFVTILISPIVFGRFILQDNVGNQGINVPAATQVGHSMHLHDQDKSQTSCINYRILTSPIIFAPTGKWIGYRLQPFQPS